MFFYALSEDSMRVDQSDSGGRLFQIYSTLTECASNTHLQKVIICTGYFNKYRDFTF